MSLHANTLTTTVCPRACVKIQREKERERVREIFYREIQGERESAPFTLISVPLL